MRQGARRAWWAVLLFAMAGAAPALAEDAQGTDNVPPDNHCTPTSNYCYVADGANNSWNTPNTQTVTLSQQMVGFFRARNSGIIHLQGPVRLTLGGNLNTPVVAMFQALNSGTITLDGPLTLTDQRANNSTAAGFWVQSGGTITVNGKTEYSQISSQVRLAVWADGPNSSVIFNERFDTGTQGAKTYLFGARNGAVVALTKGGTIRGTIGAPSPLAFVDMGNGGTTGGIIRMTEMDIDVTNNVSNVTLPVMPLFNLVNGGEMELTDTVAGFAATAYNAGGFYLQAIGGATPVPGTITLDNSTIQLKSAGSMIYQMGGTYTVEMKNRSALALSNPSPSNSLADVNDADPAAAATALREGILIINATDSTLAGNVQVRKPVFGTGNKATVNLMGSSTWTGRITAETGSSGAVSLKDTAKWTGSITAPASSAEVTLGGGTWVANAAPAGLGKVTFGGGTLEADVSGLSFAAPTQVLVSGSTRSTIDTERFDVTISSPLTGSGTLEKKGTHNSSQTAGRLTLTGDSSTSFTGTMIVSEGDLIVNGKLGGSMLVRSGGALRGTSAEVGKTTVEGGGQIFGQDGSQMVFNGGLLLDPGAIVNAELGAKTAPPVFVVNGDLTIDGTLNISDTGAFSPGLYSIFSYTGSLTDNGLEIGSVPSGILAGDIDVITDRPGTVYINNTTGTNLNYWKGGSGEWNMTSNNWTDRVGGTTFSHWRNDHFALFWNKPGGTVRVNNAHGMVRAGGMQFAIDGYRIEGDPLTLSAARSIIRTGTGPDGPDVTATIAAKLIGTGALVKQDKGTLILEGANEYSGGTVLEEGALQVSSDENLGTGDLTFDGGTLRVMGNKFTSTRRDIIWGVDGGGFDIVEANTRFEVDQALKGKGRLTKTGAGTLELSGKNTYTGLTTVSEGMLLAGGADVFSPNSITTVSAHGMLNLNGHDQTLQQLINFGSVKVGGAQTVGTTLTVGDYNGQGGTVHINAQLGRDGSPTDLLHITNSSANNSILDVTNVGGRGAQTKDGIMVVKVDKNSHGNFTLDGDYLFDNEPAVVAGAYAYRLFKGTPSVNDGNWYLRSELKDRCVGPNCPCTGPDCPCTGPNCPHPPHPQPQPHYQAGVPVYQAQAQALQAINSDVGTLRQRVGNRYWSGAAGQQGEGKDTGEPASKEGRAAIDTPANVWGRIESAHSRYQPRYSTTGMHYDVDSYRAQAGFDGQFYETEAGSLIGGLTMQYAYAKADSGSRHGTGNVSIDGYGFGGTLTWYGVNGLYADAQAQVNWYNNDLSSATAHRSLASDVNGFGYALSLEGGWRLGLDAVSSAAWASNWTLTPQAQIIWSSVDFSGFHDVFGAHVTHDQSESLRGRIGISADYSQSWRDQQGRLSRAEVYAIANLYYQFQQASKIKVAGHNFVSENERPWGGVGGGGTYSWADGRYAIYGEVTIDTSLRQFADSYSLGGNLGFKVRW
jgi:fibronectin-binding autotransporter adhesin